MRLFRIAVYVRVAASALEPVDVARTLSAAKYSRRLKRLLQSAEALFLLGAGSQWKGEDERDEVQLRGSVHSGFGWWNYLGCSGSSGRPFVARIGALFLALATKNDAAKSADDADERTTVVAGVTLGRALLVAAGTANHRIAFTEDRAHGTTMGRSDDGLPGGRIAQSTSGPTFDNALSGLKPAGEPVRPRVRPSLRHRGKPPLFPIALETQPALTVLAGHFHGSSKGITAAVRSAPAIRESRDLPGARPRPLGDLPCVSPLRPASPAKPPTSCRSSRERSDNSRHLLCHRFASSRG